MEELKYIVETIMPLVEVGAIWTIIYLMMHLLLPYFVGLSVLWAAYAVVSRIIRAAEKAGNNQARLCQLRDAAGIGGTGELTGYEYKQLLHFVQRHRSS